MDIQQWLLALPGMVGLLATIIKIISDWRKGKAEATVLVVDGAVDVVNLLRQELADARQEIAILKGRVMRLERQVRDLGGVPTNGN